MTTRAATALMALVTVAAPAAWAQPAAPAPAPAPADSSTRRDDGFLGPRRVTLAVDDCPRAPDLTQAQREALASEHYYRGDVLYVQGDYEGAVRELVASYCANPLAAILKIVGQSYERMVEYELAAAYYERYVLEADAQAADRKSISARVQVLRRLPSIVTVATEPPGSTVELANDSGRQALGRDGERLQVTAGTYEMTVSHAGYQPRVTTITVGIGQPYSFSFRLDPRRSRLHVQTVPGDARIFVDGRLAGLGAYDADVTLGAHDVMAEAPGRRSQQVTVEIVDGENRPVAITLPPLPGSGRRHLIAGSIALGGLMGAGTGGLGGSEGASGAGFVLGAVGGGAAGYLFIPDDVRLGTGSFLVSTGLAGALNGLALGGALNDRDEVFANDDDATGAGYGMVGGAMIGVGAGLALASRLDVSPGDAALFNSGVSWGAVTGALFIPAFQAESRVRYATLIAGLDLGVLAGGLLATRYDVSRRRVVFIDIAGVAGMIAGLATESAVSGATSDQGSSERTAHYALAGMSLGLGLGTFFTRNLDLPRLPSLAPTVTRSTDGVRGATTIIGVGGAM